MWNPRKMIIAARFLSICVAITVIVSGTYHIFWESMFSVGTKIFMFLLLIAASAILSSIIGEHFVRVCKFRRHRE